MSCRTFTASEFNGEFFKPRASERGFGLLAAVTVLILVSMSIIAVAPGVYEAMLGDKSARTFKDLQMLKIALAGNPRLTINNGRIDFGYVGNMGNVPSSLSKLWLRDNQNPYSFDNTITKVGAGWLGPYVQNVHVERLLALDQDAFGYPIIYASTPFTRASDNQTVAARLQSAGPDGVTDSADDLIIDLLNSEIYATVTGAVKRGANPVGSAAVTLNTPSNGSVIQQTAVTNSSGVFTFTNATFGLRSVSIDPKLTYEDGSANVQGGDTLRFTVTNYATNAVSITSIKATYATTMYYEKIRIGNTDVFDYNNGTRGASGNTKVFSAINVSGSGKPTQVVPIRVDKETTVTPDLLIRGVGSSVVVQFQDFRAAQTGNSSAVNPSGTTFTVEFSDGSSNTFTAP